MVSKSIQSHQANKYTSTVVLTCSKLGYSVTKICIYVKYLLFFFQCTQHIIIVMYIFVVVSNWPKFVYELEPPFLQNIPFTRMLKTKSHLNRYKAQFKCLGLLILVNLNFFSSFITLSILTFYQY
jgi:hypothetical protein